MLKEAKAAQEREGKAIFADDTCTWAIDWNQ